MIDEMWTGGTPASASRASVMLVALLSLSNDAEMAKDPFERRMRLNEMQAAIQLARGEIEAFAEGMLFGGGDEEIR